MGVQCHRRPRPGDGVHCDLVRVCGGSHVLGGTRQTPPHVKAVIFAGEPPRAVGEREQEPVHLDTRNVLVYVGDVQFNGKKYHFGVEDTETSVLLNEGHLLYIRQIE